MWWWWHNSFVYIFVHEAKMLNICSKFAMDMDVKINTWKPLVMRIDPCFNALYSSLILCDRCLLFANEIRYLSIYIRSGSHFILWLVSCKTKFIRSINAIYAKFKCAKSKVVCGQLLKSYCVPIIMSAVGAAWPSKSNAVLLDDLITPLCHGPSVW